MASQLIREWVGIRQFPPATQSKLLDLLGNLKQQDVNTLTILVMGKSGVGKSFTVNSIVGERAVSVSAFQFPSGQKERHPPVCRSFGCLQSDNMDKHVIKAITDSFGKDIWRRAFGSAPTCPAIST